MGVHYKSDCFYSSLGMMAEQAQLYQLVTEETFWKPKSLDVNQGLAL